MKASLRLFVWLALLALPFIRVFAQGGESNGIFLAQMKPSEAVDSAGAPSKDKRREEEIPKDKGQNKDKGRQQSSPREGGTSKEPSGSVSKQPSGGSTKGNSPQGGLREGGSGGQPSKKDGKGNTSQSSPRDGGTSQGGSASKQPSGSDKGSTSQGSPRDGGTSKEPSGGSGKDSSPQGNLRGKDSPPQDRRRGGSRDSPPHDRRAQPRGGSAIWWESYLSLSVPLPIISRDCGDDGSFSSAGAGVGFSLHKVNPETHFAMLVRMGLALTSGEFSGGFEDSFAEGQDVSIGDVSAVYSYFRFGLGGAIELGGSGGFVLIPTAGVGASYSTMSADVSVQQVYPTGVFEDSYEATGGEVTLDVFVDLTALVMFTDHFGLSASFEAAVNMLGTGSFDDASYTVLPPSYTITPAVSLCFRF